MTELELECHKRFTLELNDGTVIPGIPPRVAGVAWDELVFEGGPVKSFKRTHHLGNLNGFVSSRKLIPHEDNFEDRKVTA